MTTEEKRAEFIKRARYNFAGQSQDIREKLAATIGAALEDASVEGALAVKALVDYIHDVNAGSFDDECPVCLDPFDCKCEVA